jgi:glycosyltransferase involved in cell wall biosynthesis
MPTPKPWPILMPHNPVILQVIPALETGGAERTVIEVAEAIVKAGGTALVASEGGRLESEMVRAGGEIIHLPMGTKNPARMLANAQRLRRIIERRNVDLVHARSRAPAWSAWFAASRLNKPFVTTYHGIYNQKGRIKGWYNSIMARGDLVIANSHYTAGILKQRHGTPEGRVRVIPRGVDLERFSPAAVPPERVAALRERWGVPSEARLVVQAARLTRWKGQFVTIGAAARILEKPDFRDVVFILAGDDQGRTAYRDELANRIAALGLSERILLTGHCTDMPAAFAAATLAIVPSIEPEAFGRISIEAQAMGCPVIVSQIGALPETIGAASPTGSGTPGTGWTFPAGDEAALARQIEAALMLPEAQIDAMAEAARRRVAALYSKQALQRQTLLVYDNLLDSALAPGFDRNLAANEASPPSFDRISV